MTNTLPYPSIRGEFTHESARGAEGESRVFRNSTTAQSVNRGACKLWGIMIIQGVAACTVSVYDSSDVNILADSDLKAVIGVNALAGSMDGETSQIGIRCDKGLVIQMSQADATCTVFYQTP